MNVKLVFYPYWIISGPFWVCIEVSLNVPALRFTTHCEQTSNLFCRKIKRGSGVLTVQILLRIRWWGGTDTSVRTSSFVRGQERWIKRKWYFWTYSNACFLYQPIVMDIFLITTNVTSLNIKKGYLMLKLFAGLLVWQEDPLLVRRVHGNKV